MITNYTLEQMLLIWRTRQGFVTNSDSLVRTDIVDLDAYLRQQIDDWYFTQLDTAPIHLLNIEECSAEATILSNKNGVVTVALPERCRRVVSVRLKGWVSNARIVTDPDSTIARLQRSPWVCGGNNLPVAVINGKTMTIYSSRMTIPQIEALHCICTPEDGFYPIDRAALSTIPIIDSNP